MEIQMIVHNDGLPNRLKRAREYVGYSQAQLAKKANIPPASISNFESGAREPSYDSLRRICFALNVSADYFIGRSDSLKDLRVVGVARQLQKLDDYKLEIVERLIEALVSENIETHKVLEAEDE